MTSWFNKKLIFLVVPYVILVYSLFIRINYIRRHVPTHGQLRALQVLPSQITVFSRMPFVYRLEHLYFFIFYYKKTLRHNWHTELSYAVFYIFIYFFFWCAASMKIFYTWRILKELLLFFVEHLLLNCLLYTPALDTSLRWDTRKTTPLI